MDCVHGDMGSVSLATCISSSDHKGGRKKREGEKRDRGKEGGRKRGKERGRRREDETCASIKSNTIQDTHLAQYSNAARDHRYSTHAFHLVAGILVNVLAGLCPRQQTCRHCESIEPHLIPASHPSRPV